jgi:hypothetical protein
LRQIRLHSEGSLRQIHGVFEFSGHARSLSTPHRKKAGNFIIGDGFEEAVGVRSMKVLRIGLFASPQNVFFGDAKAWAELLDFC